MPAPSTDGAFTPTYLPTPPKALVDTETENEQLVLSPEEDIAMNEYLERMTVGVVGRKMCQKIYIRTPNNKLSKDSYDAISESDAHTPGSFPPVLPSSMETESQPNTQQFLVVGIVLARTPFEYSDKATTKGGTNTQSKDARAKRGVLQADPDVLRAVVPVTEHVSNASIKFYVACGEIKGLCGLHLISGDAIFFFKEVWAGIPTDTNKRQRKFRLSLACKTLAARQNATPPRVMTSTTKTTGKDQTKTNNDLSLAVEKKSANFLHSNLSLWSLTKNRSEQDVLVPGMEAVMPDLKKRKRPSNEGAIAFFMFDEALNKDGAQALISEIKSAHPWLGPLERHLIVSAHDILRKEREHGKPLGDCLPHGSIALFLYFIHDRAVSGWDVDMLRDAVYDILKHIHCVNLLQPPITGVVGSAEGGNDEAKWVSHVSALGQQLTSLEHYHADVARGPREQHGGVQSHESFD